MPVALLLGAGFFGNQVRVLEQILQLAGQAMGMLVSTQDPDHAFLCADRVMLLHEGRIAAIGKPEAVITRENLRRVYGTEVDVAHVRVGGRARAVCFPVLQSGDAPR